MRFLPKTRYLVYLVTIVVLGAVWALGEGGPLRLDSLEGLRLFRAPSQDNDVPFVNQPVREVSTDPTPGTSQDPDRAFKAALNSLSSDLPGDGGIAMKSESALVTPTVASDAGKDDSRAGRDRGSGDANDVRQMFVTLQDSQGSRIQDDGMIGGVVSRANSLGAGPERFPTPSTTPTNARPWAYGQARGYTMLYAMQPEARPVVEANIEALLSARVREPYIGVLIDGTFGRDFSYLKDVITRLSMEDRALTLVLYLSNGPNMRDEKSVVSTALFSGVLPEQFRQQIRRVQSLRNEFLAVAAQARDLFLFNASVNSGNNNVAIVMLEDNLDVIAYREMRSLADEQLESIAGFVRNPCLDCGEKGEGAVDDDTAGNPREEHTLARFEILKTGDGYSLDGVGFRYPGTNDIGISPEQLTSLMNRSMEKGLRYAGLWRHAWQGVSDNAPRKLPKDRTYVPSTPDQQEFEIQALRTGLFAESDDEEQQ